MKNTLNSIKETAKKQTKHIALASALIATLGSCGNKTENSQTTSTDSIKTEQTINTKQDTLISTEKTPTQTMETSNEQTLDEILAEREEEDKKQEAEKQQTEWEKRGLSKEDREAGLQLHTELKDELANCLKYSEVYRQDAEFLESVKEYLDMHHKRSKILGIPTSKEAKEAQKRYNQFKK